MGPGKLHSSYCFEADISLIASEFYIILSFKLAWVPVHPAKANLYRVRVK